MEGGSYCFFAVKANRVICELERMRSDPMEVGVIAMVLNNRGASNGEDIERYSLEIESGREGQWIFNFSKVP